MGGFKNVLAGHWDSRFQLHEIIVRPKPCFEVYVNLKSRVENSRLGSRLPIAIKPLSLQIVNNIQPNQCVGSLVRVHRLELGH